MKVVNITTDALIGKHKPSDREIAGFGLIHEDQYIICYLTSGRRVKLFYEEIKVGGHAMKQLDFLDKGELITKIDIRSINED